MIDPTIETRALGPADRQRIWHLAYRLIGFFALPFGAALLIFLASAWYMSHRFGGAVINRDFWPLLGIILGLWGLAALATWLYYARLLRGLREIHLVRGKIDRVETYRRGPVYYHLGRERVAASAVLPAAQAGQWRVLHCYRDAKTFTYHVYFFEELKAGL
jgi:hypothetical protein